MDNIWKPRGILKSQKPDAGGAVLRNYPMMGIVKDTVDPTKSGRIRVYISALGATDPDDEKNWTPVLYMSPFFGLTDTTGGNSDYGSFKANPASYGMWASPPDVGTIVICLFINGDPNFGFYIGSIPDAEAMRMVPAIGANFSTENVIFNEKEATKYGGATRVPVTNMNTNNSKETDNPSFIDSPKPVHSFQASIMFQQGVLRDPLRGPISSSAQRESPSRVGWGVSTPGRPIYEGGATDATIADAVKSNQTTGLKVVSRRGGHSIVMDDGDLIGRDNLVRIRTSLGHQILMSDDGQTLMILHSNGQSYIELGKEGTIDMYSTNSVNIRTHGDLNLHADNNININAQKQLNIHADEININSETTIKQKSGSDYNVYTQGTHTHKVDGSMSMASAGEASYASSATTYINGSVINLNTGSSSTTPQDVAPIPIIAQTDTLFSKEKGWAASPGKLLTIASRAPAHAPWANAGQGVDVKLNLDADSQLPTPPSPTVASTNTVASTAPNTAAITVPGAATVPPVSAASTALDKNTTSALVSASAAQAAIGSAASAVKAGAGTITDAAGKVTGVAVGVTGLSAKALESANTIKPGSGALVNSLVQAGKTVQQAMPSSLFTGQPGAANLPNLVNNTVAQANATVATIQKSQSLLTQAGAVTGKENPAAIAGPILSGAVNGANATVSALKNAGNVVNKLETNVQGAASGVMNSIAGGNFAANLSQNVMGGLSGIANSVTSMAKGLGSVVDNAKGIAASAFASVTKSFKSFKANVPQDLTAIKKQNQQTENASETKDPYAGLSTDQIAKLGSADPTDPFIRSRLGLPALSNVPSVSSLASGVSNLPGGTGTIASVVNKATGSINTLPGASEVKTLINNATTAATNNVSLNSAVSAAKGLAGTPVSGLSSVTGALGNLPNVPGAASLTGSLNSLKSGATNLTSLVSSGLSSSAASQLNSAIASLGSGGPVQIKMPTVAINTTDRSSVTSAISSVLPAGVPAPNFTGTSSPEEAQGASTLEENAARLKDQKKRFNEQLAVADAAKKEWVAAANSLPAGDPKIAELRQKFSDEYTALSRIIEELS